MKVAHAHLRYLNPMPRNTGEVLKRYKQGPGAGAERRPAVPCCCGRSSWSTPSALNKVQGKPFLVSEIEDKIDEMLARNYSPLP